MIDWKDRKNRQDFYHSVPWLYMREIVLSEEPLCRRCKEKGLIVPATEVDHLEDIQDRPDLRLERSNLQGLCKSCHSMKTISKLQDLYKKSKDWAVQNPKWKLHDK